MKPVAFEYFRASTVQQAVSRLYDENGGAKVIAGGQSLGPMLNLRLARPKTLVDIGRIAELKQIRSTPERLIIGAGVTHAEIEDGILSGQEPGLMQGVAAGIAYRAVRNRGTIGGSLSHADPAADWIVAMTALDAALEIQGRNDRRRVPLAAFFKSAFTTILQDDEVVVAIDAARLSPEARWAHRKLARKSGKFADASVVAISDRNRGFASVVVGRPDSAPISIPELADWLRSDKAPPAIDEIADRLDARAGVQDAYERHIQIALLADTFAGLALQ